MCVFLFFHIGVHIHAHRMYVCMYVCMHACMYVSMRVCVYVWVCICACACVCVCVCTWLATHVKEPWSSLKGIKERDLYLYIYIYVFPRGCHSIDRPFLGSGKRKEKPPFHVPPTSERHTIRFEGPAQEFLPMRSCIECRVQKQTFT